jgi:hypothetical protein
MSETTGNEPHALRAEVERVEAALPSQPGVLVAALHERSEDYLLVVVRGGIDELVHRGYEPEWDKQSFRINKRGRST